MSTSQICGDSGRDLIHSWDTVRNQTLRLWFVRGSRVQCSLLNQEGREKWIACIQMPWQQGTTKEQIQAFCHNTYIQLSPFGDNVCKISIFPKIFGGMYQVGNYGSLKDLSDMEIANAFQQKLPHHTYTSISVDSGNHSFQQGDAVPTRLITIYRAATSVATETLFSFLLGWFNPTEAERKYNSQIDTNKIKDQLLSVNNNGMEEIKKAYAQCAKILLWISEDLNQCELTVEQCSLVKGGLTVGKILNALQLFEQRRS